MDGSEEVSAIDISQLIHAETKLLIETLLFFSLLFTGLHIWL